jgi:hypothetical protein
MVGSRGFITILETVRGYLAQMSSTASGSGSGDSHRPMSHPKLDVLVRRVREHFEEWEKEKLRKRAEGGPSASSSDAPGTASNSDEETRVMVFAQYRDSVEEIAGVLRGLEPLVRVMSFVGQSSGKTGAKAVTQKQQMEVSESDLFF